jgi:hypothetical protein
MRIHFLTSAHNSLSQRLLVELTERGHKVTVAIRLRRIPYLVGDALGPTSVQY